MPRPLFYAATTVCLFLTCGSLAKAQSLLNRKHADDQDRFAQIDSWLPTPDNVRTAGGAPGPEYWQQRCDYEIDVTLDDDNQRIEGICKITYHNRSPHDLDYLWIQLDQNRFDPQSDGRQTQTAPALAPRTGFDSLRSILAAEVFEGGYDIRSVTDDQGNSFATTVVDTMMRIELDKAMPPGGIISLAIDYGYNIVNSDVMRARGGYEYFEDDDNYIYEIAQWYPRIAAYTDYTGWQNKQFLGRGEFTLELGDFAVNITAPADMIVGATGVLQNDVEVLTETQRERLDAARTSEKPVFIVTPEEAEANEAKRSGETKTWSYVATNVRDFAFAASRKFIWDALGTQIDLGETTQDVLAMSYYPNEAEPLWSQYSTEAIVHTLDVYGRYSFPYPYPIAISVNGPVYGMEYPMICFNGPRPEEDGTYSKTTKYALISVIIHEVGHNFFPMIVNSDERQWTWMDEGLNTFLQYLTEQEWEDDYPSRRGDPEKMAGYMGGGNQRPIMTGSEEILQFGNNAYAKPATALNVLRETILGRENFDYAFRTYSRRWMFKRPTPADFFRTMEDASGEDLDWFWRGWFYSTDHVDIGIQDLDLFVIDDGDPDAKAERDRQKRESKTPTLSKERNESLRKRIDWQPGLKDFYNSSDYDPHKVDASARKAFQKYLDGLDEEQRALLRRKTNFYVATFENVGGLVMPIIVKLHFDDSTTKTVTIPAQIWRSNGDRVRKLFLTEKTILRIELDPRRETADTNTSNNHFPPKVEPTRFKLFKSKTSKNEMQKAKKEGEKESDGEGTSEDEGENEDDD